jgi:hypothetical protein
MQDFYKKHRYYLLVLVILILVAGASGMYLISNLRFQIFDLDHNQPVRPTNVTTNITTVQTMDVNQHTPALTPATVLVSAPLNRGETTSTNLIPKNQNLTPSTSPVIPHPEPEFKNPITLTINGEQYQLEFKEKQTVYQFMQALSADSRKPFIFATKEYPGMGMFVESINDIKNEPQNNKYWIYYINNQPAKIGISNYLIQKGDKIEWKYENSNM